MMIIFINEKNESIQDKMSFNYVDGHQLILNQRIRVDMIESMH